MTQLQTELATTRTQMAQMAAEHDNLRQAREALRAATDTALQAKASEIASSEAKLKQLMSNQKFDLLDMKTLQPETFKGKQSEAFKPWARKVKAFCNAKKVGFRRALEWSEVQTMEITDVRGTGWEQAEIANEKLHDFLLQLCGDEARAHVDGTVCPSNRFHESMTMLLMIMMSPIILMTMIMLLVS